MGKIDERFKAMQHARLGKMQFDDVGERGNTMHEVLMQAKTNKVKGEYDGLCNRSACLSPDDVHYYNIGSYAFYCPDCAHLLNASNRKFKDINNGEPYVTFKTPEEAAELHVMPRRINYSTLK